MKQIKINTTVNDEYELHAQLKSMFETSTPRYYHSDGIISVLSEKMPDNEISYDGKSKISSANDIKIENGKYIEFSMKFNPTKMTTVNGKRTKQGIIESNEVDKWISWKLSNSGCEIIDTTFKREPWVRFEKRNGVKVSGPVYLAGGFLKVVDADRFNNAIASGLGGMKFAGYGAINVHSIT